MVKIIDCFLFSDEFQMLDFRLAEMSHAVDHHIIVEADRTMAGEAKPFHFADNKERYAKYLDKIISVTVCDMPTKDQVGERAFCPMTGMEYHQRRCMSRGIEQLDLSEEDLIIISDCDEVPDSHTLEHLRNVGLSNEMFCLNLDLYYYNWTCKCGGWTGAKICTIAAYESLGKDTEKIRDLTSLEFAVIQRGGWHCSYFGGPKAIIKKLKTFSHQELNDPKYLDEDKIRETIRHRKDVLFRSPDVVGEYTHVPLKDNPYLPNHYELLLDGSEGSEC